MISQNEWFAVAALAGAYGLAFFAAFAVRKLFPNQKELSRKTVHVLGGLISTTLPFVIFHWEIVAVMTGILLAALIITRRIKFMEAVHGVGRDSWGVYLFPISIFCLYIWVGHNPVLYLIGTLVLSLSDTAAALVGRTYGKFRFDLDGNLKSLEGTTSFAFVTYIAVQTPLLLMTNWPPLQIILISFVAAWVVTGFELISLSGTDNIVIPLGTVYLVERMSHYPVEINWETLWWLVVAVVWTLVVFAGVKGLKSSYKLTIALFNFATLALVGHLWPVPTLIFEVLLAIAAWIGIRKQSIPPLQVRYVLSLAAIPTVLMFVSAGIDQLDILFPAFLTALVCQGAALTWELVILPTEKPRPWTRLGSAAWLFGHWVLIAGIPAGLILNWKMTVITFLSCALVWLVQQLWELFKLPRGHLYFYRNVLTLLGVILTWSLGYL